MLGGRLRIWLALIQVSSGQTEHGTPQLVATKLVQVVPYVTLFFA